MLRRALKQRIPQTRGRKLSAGAAGRLMTLFVLTMAWSAGGVMGNSLAAAAESLSTMVVAGAVAAAEPTVADPTELEFFEQTIRPLLVEKCQSCHGAQKEMMGLRVDSIAALRRGGESGPAIIPGHPEQSLLVDVIRYDGDIQMPPDGRLTDAEIAAISRWIERGAAWPAVIAESETELERKQRTHWAFQPVVDPPIPEVAAGTIVQTPVDAFLQSRLAEQGLVSSPPADVRTLARRMSYGLTGLPPAAADLEALAIDHSTDAWARYSERLLSSTEYGEHWARKWLDLARFSNMKGYVYGREFNEYLHASQYRDWVIAAFRDDMPYNLFLERQIAADQRPEDDRSQLVAMGFLTLGRRFLGVPYDILDDRIDVMTRGMLGLTVGCARCHDHKYDPIPTADYYSLSGVFQSSADRLVPLVDRTVIEQHPSEFAKVLRERLAALETTTRQRQLETDARVRSRIADYLLAQRELQKYPAEGFDQVLAADDLIPSFVRRFQRALERRSQADDPVLGLWHRLVGVPDAEFSDRAAQFWNEWRAAAATVSPRILAAFETPPTSAAELARRIASVLLAVDAEWRADPQVASVDVPPCRDPSDQPLHDFLYGPGSPCVVPRESIYCNETLYPSAVVDELWRLQNAVDSWLAQSAGELPFALVLEDRPAPVTPRILRRGNPLQVGDEVPRQFLKLIAGPDRQPFAHGSGRKELALAITDPRNPLTARVWVNRIWAAHFGVGLVRTPSDFGIRAETPSHPELLDWLACRLVESGWSTKAIQRLIVRSAAYQQSSRGAESPDMVARAEDQDPENRLRWRAPVRRLSFEEVRDSLIEVSQQRNPVAGGRHEELFVFGQGLMKRGVYVRIDRQFVPGVMRLFDFANPDLHIPQRSETMIPQQALFSLNHPWVIERAQRIAGLAVPGAGTSSGSPGEQVQSAAAAPEAAAGRVRELFRRILQRQPSPGELDVALNFIDEEQQRETTPRFSAEQLAWSYGYGPWNADTGQLAKFDRLPYFNGSAWQGGGNWPDPALGWLQLTATGGHPGNDLNHAVVRRWTASRAMTVLVDAPVQHRIAVGNGVRCSVTVTGRGLIHVSPVHNQTVDIQLGPLSLQAGDQIDFVVDHYNDLNHDQFDWSPRIRESPAAIAGSEAPPAAADWDSARDFVGPPTQRLSAWELLAQTLLMSNEFVFLD